MGDLRVSAHTCAALSLSLWPTSWVVFASEVDIRQIYSTQSNIFYINNNL